MTIVIQPATEENDAGVTALFRQMGVPVHEAYWQRAYSDDFPDGGASKPFVALNDEGLVLGFAAARPFDLFVESEFVPAQVLHDFLVNPLIQAKETARLLLERVHEGATLTLAAGTGVEASKVLEANRYQLGAFMSRFRLDPETAPPAADASIPRLELAPVERLDEAFAETIVGTLAGERRVFRYRSAENLHWLFRGPEKEYEVLRAEENDGKERAYAVLRHVEGRSGPETHLVDAGCGVKLIRRLAAALARYARHRERRLFVSLLADNWRQPLADEGFTPLPARWPIYWFLSDPQRRAIANAMLRREAWFFTPADGDLDQWG